MRQSLLRLSDAAFVAALMWAHTASPVAATERFSVVTVADASAQIVSDQKAIVQSPDAEAFFCRLDDALSELDVAENELGPYVAVDVSGLGFTRSQVAFLANAIGDGDYRNRDEAHRALESVVVEADEPELIRTVEAHLSRSKGEIVRRQTFVDAALTSYIETAKSIADERERVVYLCGVCGELLDYDETLYVRDVYDALLSGRGICQSYAKLMYDLCCRCGIDASLVVGQVEDVSGTSDLHMWCAVTVDGQQLYSDPTGADTTTSTSRVLGTKAEFEALGYTFV